MRAEQGFGLIEIMIAVLLASLIIIVLMQHYLTSKQSYLNAQILLEREFELQLVSDLIRDSVRRAGFTPCLNIAHLQTVDRRTNRTMLSAIETDVGKSHALHLKRMSEYFTPVLQILNPTRILVASGPSYEIKRSFLLADCYHAEVQQVSSLQQSSEGIVMTFPYLLAFHYSEPIYVGEWVEEVFFIQKNRQGKQALFYQINHAEELTAVINKLTASTIFHQGKTLLAVKLGLDNGQSLTLETTVRAS